MAKTKGKTFWQRFKWWLYALQWVFTAIGIYQVVIWMAVPENRKNALIGAVIAAGFLLFGAIAVWRARAAKRKTAGPAAKSSTARKPANGEVSAQPASSRSETVRDGAVGKIQKGRDSSATTADVSSPMNSAQSDEERMRAIEEELSKHG